MIPHKGPMTERATMPESTRHMSKKATRKETMLYHGKKCEICAIERYKALTSTLAAHTAS